MDEPGAQADVRWLTSHTGTQAREAAMRVRQEAGSDPLRAASQLRASADLSPAQVAAVLEQAELSERATRQGFAPGALLTRDGLEAATRPAVAAYRAQTLVASGARRVVDLTAGLGFDSQAFLEAGLAVTAVERDPWTAELLAHNCPQARVVHSDATDPECLALVLQDLGPDDVVFVDPARRDPLAARDTRTARARPERDPERWSPPWSWVAALPHPRIAVKASPGFRPPPGWHAQWVSVDRTVVECALYSWPVTAASRTAVVVRDGVVVASVSGDGPAVPAADETLAWLVEADPAVLAAGAIAGVNTDGTLLALGQGSTWLTSAADPDHPALRGYAVITELAGSARERRQRLREYGVTSATVKCRDTDDEPARVLADLGLREGPGHVLVLTRRAGRTAVFLAREAQPRR